MNARRLAVAGRTTQGALALLSLRRLARGRRRRAPLVATAPEAALPPISVVIPARNEAARLPGVLGPLARGAPGVREVIVVDDGSTDATAAVAEEHGAAVIPGTPPPPGWIGKPWALDQGLRAASGQIVVFLDADVVPRPELPAAVAGLLEGADLASATLAFICPGLGQRLLHPALLTTLALRVGPLDVRGQLPASLVAINGQCFAVRRAQLLAAGGFAATGGISTDDVALARHLRRRGWRVAVADGGALGSVRMYESATEALREWAGRSLALPGAATRRRQLVDLALVWAVQGVPALGALTAARRAIAGRSLLAATRRLHPLDAGLLALRLALVVALRTTYRRPAPSGSAAPGAVDRVAMLAPAADLVAVAALTRGTLRPVRRWRGRDL